METLSFLLKNFFTHKDFLPSADQIAGTLFTPLHLIFSAFCLALVILLSIYLSKKSIKTLRTFYTVLWVVAVVSEVAKILWETYCGANISFEWGGILPLYPCSIFMYALPFAIWGGEKVRFAACGYVCTLGFFGGAINFVYPANVISNYSCISFAGFHTLFYHGAIILCALTMLLSGYHKFSHSAKKGMLFLPVVPFLVMSVFANAVNFSPIGSDYMFFKLNSFFFAPIGAATPDIVSVIIVYIAYFIIHIVPYLPFYFKAKKATKKVTS